MVASRHVSESNTARGPRCARRVDQAVEHSLQRRVSSGSRAPSGGRREINRDGGSIVVAVVESTWQRKTIARITGPTSRGGIRSIDPVSLQLNPNDVIGLHVCRSSIGACTAEADANALSGRRREDRRPDHLTGLAANDRERVEICISRGRQGRRAVTQFVGSRNRLTVPQPLNRPRPIDLCQESRRRPDQRRRIDRLFYECRLAARIALGGGEKFHFAHLHTTGVVSRDR